MILQSKEVEGNIPIQEWIKTRYDFQQDALRVAQRLQGEHDARHLEKTDTGELRTEYAISEQVLLSYPPTVTGGNGRPNKLHTNLTGPYTVKQIVGTEEYILRDGRGKLTAPISVHRLRKYYYDPARVDPGTEAMCDDESYIVERIISTHGSFNRKKELAFLVKWEGYDEPTLTSWRSLYDNSVLHEYLRANGLGKHIPSKFRE